ncbi:hypothetical protein [Nostoc sp.]|uniref:hypothetical protein n=1 Tax=Nostoc sp. TaxID=1180 RepID=UPI002FFAA926
MMAINSEKELDNRWLSFAKQMIPRNASAVQTQEMRRAFYSGASIMFELIINTPEGVSEDDGVGRLSALNEQCVNFFSRVGKDH